MLTSSRHSLLFWLSISSAMMLCGCKESVSEGQKAIAQLAEENAVLTKTASELGRRMESMSLDRSDLLRSLGDGNAQSARKEKLERELSSVKSDLASSEKDAGELTAVLDNLRKKYLYQ